MRVLAHKDVFGDMMEFSRDMAPESYDFIPPTYNLPNARELKRF
jgi:hypothetical protein